MTFSRIKGRLRALEALRSDSLADTADKEEIEAFIALFAYGAEHLPWERYDSDKPYLPEAVKRATYQMSSECHGNIPGLENLILEPAPWSLSSEERGGVWHACTPLTDPSRTTIEARY